MRALLVVGLLMVASAKAQVLHCPPQYPRETHALAGDANAFVSPSPLSGGGMYWGEPGGNGEMHGERRYSKAGVDVKYALLRDEKKWFVCQYGEGSVTVWTAVDARVTSCSLQQRSGAKPVSALSVTVDCK